MKYYLDLFSGIAGLGLAVQHRMQPALYCDIDPYCQRVLAARTSEGTLAKAPVFNDVRALTRHNIPHARDVDAIVAGFPCQSLSYIGKKVGITKGESALFYEILRLVDELPGVRTVFMENVPHLVNLSLDAVLAELRDRGFSARWSVVAASDLGAWHQRRRWFIVAHRGEAPRSNREAKPRKTAMPSNTIWSSEKVPRIAVKPEFGEDANYDANWRNRQMALGNAVVPCVARYAFDGLSADLKQLLLRARASGFDPEQSESGSLVRVTKTDRLYSGYLFDGKLFEAGGLRYPPDGITWVPPGVQLATGATRPSFQTPRSHYFYGTAKYSPVLTPRDWVHFIKCSRESVAYARDQGIGATCLAQYSKMIPNPNWLEWLMGFPPNWTRLQPQNR
jgi:DNA (cytosine-5)-methyltransferase 1